MSNTPTEPPVGPPPFSGPDSEPPTPSPQVSSAVRTWVVAGAAAAMVVVVGSFAILRSGGSEVGDTDAIAAAGLVGAGAGGQIGANGQMAGSPPGAFGEVLAVEGSTLAVQSTDPTGDSTTVTVETSGDTVVSESVDGDLSDLSVGDTVIATGDAVGCRDPRRCRFGGLRPLRSCGRRWPAGGSPGS